MSTPTGDPRAVAQLNELLGRELGRNEYGKPYFTWRWSEDLFWPAFATGRSIIHETKVLTPIIGAPKDTHDYEWDVFAHSDHTALPKEPTCACGKPESDLAHNVYSIQQTAEPEYKSDRQYRRKDTWVICKWLTPWELILGPGRGYMNIMHGQQQSTERAPSTEAVIAAWNRQFRGAPFPAKGWRVPTDAFLPNKEDPDFAASPFGHQTPNRQDTDRFIKMVRFQTSRSFAEVERDMTESSIAAENLVSAEFGEVCRDAFPAFLNPKAGSRSNFVSMPWTKQDRAR